MKMAPSAICAYLLVQEKTCRLLQEKTCQKIDPKQVQDRDYGPILCADKGIHLNITFYLLFSNTNPAKTGIRTNRFEKSEYHVSARRERLANDFLDILAKG